MAVSKVVLGNETLIDLTGDSVSSENLLQGETAHGANGEEIIGGVVVTPMYTGTKAAIEEAIALGQIPEDAVVNITDDEETSSFQTQINEINSSIENNLCFLYEPPMQTGGQGVYNFNVPENYEILATTPYCNNGGFYALTSYINGNEIGVRLISAGGSGTNIKVGLKVLVKNK